MQHLLEALAELDDDFAEVFLAEEPISVEMMRAVIRKKAREHPL